MTRGSLLTLPHHLAKLRYTQPPTTCFSDSWVNVGEMRNRFATALLGPLLLLPAASAQTQNVQTPTPAQQTNVPALPAAPAQATPAQTAPNQPASVQPVPAPATSSPAVLTLNAPVGSSVELQSIITSRITVDNVQVSAVPGSKVSQSKLNTVRREMTQAMQKMNGASTQAIRGKVFYKVASRDAAGNTVLVTTVVANIPSVPSGGKAPKMATTTLKTTQTVAPDGKVSNLSIDSDNPQLSALYRSFSPERLQQLADQNGANFGGIYGVPLVTGQPRTTTASLDAQSMMAGLLSAVAGPQGQEVFGKVQASPLTVTTSNTYTGQNAQGQYTFATSSQFADWRVTLSGKGRAPTIAMQLAQAQASGQSVYMPSGLPVASEQKTDMQMKMTLTLEGIQIAMQMTIDQGVSLQPR